MKCYQHLKVKTNNLIIVQVFKGGLRAKLSFMETAEEKENFLRQRIVRFRKQVLQRLEGLSVNSSWSSQKFGIETDIPVLIDEKGLLVKIYLM